MYNILINNQYCCRREDRLREWQQRLIAVLLLLFSRCVAILEFTTLSGLHFSGLQFREAWTLPSRDPVRYFAQCPKCVRPVLFFGRNS